MEPSIVSLGTYVPERIVTNDDLSKIVDTSDEWIVSHTGIRERRIAADDESVSDMALYAGRIALDRAGVDPSELDLVILASSSTDYINFPASACLVQDRIGAETAGAFDVSAGCTGFVYGLSVASAYIASGQAKTILMIGSEALTKITNWSDRNTCVLFGDGAGAVVIRDGNGRDGAHRIVDSYLRSKGSGERALMRPAGGSREPFDPERHTAADFQIFMDGKKVYLFAVDAVASTISELAGRNGLELDEIDWVIPHQANQRIIDAAAKRLKFPSERIFTNLDRYANTSAASIPLAMGELAAAGRVKPGDNVITVGFGAGLTYGGNLLRW